MTEQAAKSLAAAVDGELVFPAPSTRSWGVGMTRADGHFAVVEDRGGWLYRDRKAYEAYQQVGNSDALIDSREWGEWDDSEDWARNLSAVLGSNEYWHSGGGIWLVFYPRPDGRFAVIGSESGSVYASREAFESDDFGEMAENHAFV